MLSKNITSITYKPGEIWEVSRGVRSPLEYSWQEQQKLYSELTQRFLEGKSSPRYVMIVTEPPPPIDPESEWQEVSVMLLSSETNFLSDVDLLIPTEVSGVGQNLLAQTWHVLLMLTCNLLQPVGRRLSREIYDVLMTVGDYYHGLVDEVPSKEKIQGLGLKAGTVSGFQTFYRQEEAWSDVLSVPLAAYRTYLKGMRLTDAILDEAKQLERELKAPIPLRKWFENIFRAEWIASRDFFDTQAPSLAVASRSAGDFHEIHPNSQEITELIDQLSSVVDEQRQRAAKRLGDVAKGNDRAIQALINLLQTTQDDETLWTAVESLWQIDPGNPAAGVRRVKLIDLGMQVAGQTVALAVAMIQKLDGQIGILLRVYPTQAEPYLPPDLKLILLDNSGQILREVTARRADVYIQLRFNGQASEQFSVRVALQEASITEDFVI